MVIENMKEWSYENNVPWALVKSSLISAIVVGIAVLIVNGIHAFQGRGIEYFILSTLVSTIIIVLTFFSFLFINFWYYLLFKDWLLKKKLEYSVVIGILIVYFNYFFIYFLISNELEKNKIMQLSTVMVLFVGYMIGLILGMIAFHFALYKNFDFKKSGGLLQKEVMNDKERFF